MATITILNPQQMDAFEQEIKRENDSFKQPRKKPEKPFGLIMRDMKKRERQKQTLRATWNELVKEHGIVTVEMLAQAMGRSSKHVYQLVEDYEGLDLEVAMKVGDGIYEFKSYGECRVYQEDVRPDGE